MPPNNPTTHNYRCGTSAGYKWHKHNGEYPCSPCGIANNNQVTAARVRNRKHYKMMIDADVLARWIWEPASVLADHLPDIIVQALRERPQAQGWDDDKPE